VISLKFCVEAKFTVVSGVRTCCRMLHTVLKLVSDSC
jgi:hypothetical protein